MGGQLLFTRSPDPQYAYFDELFPSYAQYRQLYLEAPKVSRAGSSHRITRKVIRWKKERTPLYPMPLFRPLPSPAADGELPTYRIYTWQHRAHANSWLSAFADDPLEDIWGSVVVLRTDPDGTETWSGQRFQYTAASGVLCPSEYLVWTLLMYWAVTSGTVVPTGLFGAVTSPSSSLIAKLNSGKDAKS